MKIFKKLFKSQKDPYEKELKSIYENLNWYYRSYIKDKIITKENESALDNIAVFIVFDYDSLDFSKKMEVNRLIYIYIDVLNSIFKAYENEAKEIYESDEFFILANERFDQLYSSIVNVIYGLDTQQIKNLKLNYKKLNQIKNYYNTKRLSDEFSISDSIK